MYKSWQEHREDIIEGTRALFPQICVEPNREVEHTEEANLLTLAASFFLAGYITLWQAHFQTKQTTDTVSYNAVLASLCHDISEKYERGQNKNGDNLWMRPYQDILKAAQEEAVDGIIYSLTALGQYMNAKDTFQAKE